VSPRLSLRRPASLRVPLIASALAGLAVLGAAAAPAADAATGCTSSAARVSGSGVPAAEPARANPAATPCASDAVEVTAPAGLAPGVSLGTLRAETVAQPAAASASASVTEMGVGAEALVEQLGPVLDLGPDDTITLPIPLAPDIEVGLREALLDLIQPAAVDVVETSDIRASVTMSCVNGLPQFGGSSSIAALSIGGTSVPVDGPVTQAVTLIDTQSIDPGNIDLDLVELPAGVDLDDVELLLQPVLDALPLIQVPATVAQVQAVPNQHFVTAGGQTRRALELSVSALGQSLVNATLAEASVTAVGTDCPPAGDGGGSGTGGAGAPASESRRGGGGGGAAITAEALRCANRRLVLTDVVQSGGRVRIRGVAHADFVGRRVAIRLQATKAIVARPRVDRNGMFTATAPLPPRSIRSTNLARYRASIGSNRSLGLKLTRRLKLASTTVKNGRITMRGAITRPYPASPQTLLVKRRVTCTSWRVVKRVRVGRSGRFVVRVPAAKAGSVAVLRLQTLVPWRSDLTRLTRTYSLPRYVVR
jgi:hypothetical protein